MCVSDVMHDCDFAYEIDLVDDFFFSGAPIACVPRPITFVFDLVRCVKICRSWDSTPRPLGQKERACPTVQFGTKQGLCLSLHLDDLAYWPQMSGSVLCVPQDLSADCILSDTRL